MSTYHVGVDVTRSIYVYVDADNEKEAEDLALIEAEADSTLGAGDWVNSEVHFVDNVDTPYFPLVSPLCKEED